MVAPCAFRRPVSTTKRAKALRGRQSAASSVGDLAASPASGAEPGHSASLAARSTRGRFGAGSSRSSRRGRGHGEPLPDLVGVRLYSTCGGTTSSATRSTRPSRSNHCSVWASIRSLTPPIERLSSLKRRVRPSSAIRTSTPQRLVMCLSTSRDGQAADIRSPRRNRSESGGALATGWERDLFILTIL